MPETISQKSLEKVLHRKIKPVIDEAMHKFIGITIHELSNDISDMIEHRPLIDFSIDTNISFKAAKKLFKKQFITRLIETHYGNISDVAKVSGLDRRSVHRTVNQLNIDINSARAKMLKPEYYSKEQIDSILKTTFHDYKQFIHPEKFEKVYKNIDSLSDNIVKELPSPKLSWDEAVAEFEKAYLKKALVINNNNISKTAKVIGLRYETLLRKMKKYAIA